MLLRRTLKDERCMRSNRCLSMEAAQTERALENNNKDRKALS